MKRHTGTVLLGVAVVSAYFVGGWDYNAATPGGSPNLSLISRSEAATHLLVEPVKRGFVCPMHSHITSSHAGSKCPICSMDLVPQNTFAVGGENEPALQ